MNDGLKFLTALIGSLVFCGAVILGIVIWLVTSRMNIPAQNSEIPQKMKDSKS